MKIAQAIALFDLQMADVLRKAIGKKKADIMAQVKIQFIEGCKKAGIVTAEEAEEIFGWIQESQRYSFNKSHGISYGDIGYWTAYVKAHFPIHFFTAWLYFAHEKQKPQKEMQQLISDAKHFDLSIYPPSFAKAGDGHFAMTPKAIYFGLSDVKDVGKSHLQTIFKQISECESLLGKTIEKWTWYEFLIHFSSKVNRKAINNLIAVGATDYMGQSRGRKVFEYNEWQNLNANEQKWIAAHCPNHLKFIDALKALIQAPRRTTAPRIDKLNEVLKSLSKASFSQNDSARYIAMHEHELLGASVTCSKLDACKSKVSADTTCKEFSDGKMGKCVLCVEISTTRTNIIKSGKNAGKSMMYLSVEDETGSLESVVVFSEMLQEHAPLLIEGNTVLLSGVRDKKYTESFVVNKIVQI
jgi:DNA polymerase III alpha subunit